MAARPMGKADLHIHTNLGDGLDSVESILDHVETETDLDVIAITEHDSLQVALNARETWARRGYSFDFVAGVEITTLEGHVVALYLEDPVRQPATRRGHYRGRAPSRRRLFRAPPYELAHAQHRPRHARPAPRPRPSLRRPGARVGQPAREGRAGQSPASSTVIDTACRASAPPTPTSARPSAQATRASRAAPRPTCAAAFADWRRQRQAARIPQPARGRPAPNAVFAYRGAARDPEAARLAAHGLELCEPLPAKRAASFKPQASSLCCEARRSVAACCLRPAAGAAERGAGS